jgi:hypothetical protein
MKLDDNNRLRRLCNIFGVILLLHGIALSILYYGGTATAPKVANEYIDNLDPFIIGLACLAFGLLCFVIKHRGMLLAAGLIFLLFAGVHAVAAGNFAASYSDASTGSINFLLVVSILYCLIVLLAVKDYMQLAPAPKIRAKIMVPTPPPTSTPVEAPAEAKTEAPSPVEAPTPTTTPTPIPAAEEGGQDQFTWDISVSIK